MNIVISLESRYIKLEPETEFEREVMRKYFQREIVKVTTDNDGSLWIKWSGAAGEEKDD